jgi:hypothetical protein
MLKVPIAEPVKDKVDKAEESKVEKIMQMPKNSESSDRGNIVEDAKGFCCNAQEKENGQHTGCCAGNYKGVEPCSCKENCPS